MVPVELKETIEFEKDGLLLPGKGYCCISLYRGHVVYPSIGGHTMYVNLKPD
jgi:hypothetical protein